MDINFEAEGIEDHTFVMKQCDKHTKQPHLTLGNVDCIPFFPNSISSLLGTAIRNNDGNQNIGGSVNYFVGQLQSQPHHVYYQYCMADSQCHASQSRI